MTPSGKLQLRLAPFTRRYKLILPAGSQSLASALMRSLCDSRSLFVWFPTRRTYDDTPFMVFHLLPGSATSIIDTFRLRFWDRDCSPRWSCETRNINPTRPTLILYAYSSLSSPSPSKKSDDYRSVLERMKTTQPTANQRFSRIVATRRLCKTTAIPQNLTAILNAGCPMSSNLSAGPMTPIFSPLSTSFKLQTQTTLQITSHSLRQHALLRPTTSDLTVGLAVAHGRLFLFSPIAAEVPQKLSK